MMPREGAHPGGVLEIMFHGKSNGIRSQSEPSCHPRKPGETPSPFPSHAHALPPPLPGSRLLSCIAYSFRDVLIPARSPRRPPAGSSTSGGPPCGLEPGPYLRAARGGRSPAAAPRGRSAGPCRGRGAVRGAEAAPAPPEGPALAGLRREAAGGGGREPASRSPRPSRRTLSRLLFQGTQRGRGEGGVSAPEAEALKPRKKGGPWVGRSSLSGSPDGGVLEPRSWGRT